MSFKQALYYVAIIVAAIVIANRVNEYVETKMA